MEKGRIALILPFLSLCLGAEQSGNYAFAFSFGPFEEDHDFVLHISADARIYNGMYFFLRMTSPSFGYTESQKILWDGSHTHEEGLFRILGPNFKKGEIVSLTFGISSVFYTPSVDWSLLKLAFAMNYGINPAQERRILTEEGIYETGHRLYFYDPRINAYQTQEDTDAYCLQEMNLGKGLANRKIPLDLLALDYLNRFASPLSSPKGEIRFLNHGEDFKDIADFHGGYYSLPLDITYDPVEQGRFRYDFHLKEKVYYSRIDLKASPIPLDTEPCFLSDALFLPLREGHDEARYDYQLVLSGMGAFGDELIVQDSAFSPRFLFGDCLSSEYCVGIGG